MSFGEFLKERRKALGLSQNEIAQSLNYTPQVISKWENGLSNPTIDLSCDIAKALKISLDDYLKMDAASPIYEKEYPAFDIDSFASHLKMYRTYLGLTQKQASERTCISQQAIQRFESGKSLPDIEELKKLSALYNLDPLFIFEAKDLKELGIAKEVSTKRSRNKLLVPFCAVSALAFALAILSSVLSWKLFNGGNDNNVEDVTTNLSSNIVSQTIGTNLSLPGNPEGDSKPSDMSFGVNQVEVDGHIEYEMSLSFKNFDQYMYGGYRCTIKYLEDETWSRDIYLESVLDEYVTIKTYLADYARSGTYYIYSLVGLRPTIQNGVNVNIQEEIDLTSIERYFILDNSNQDNTAPKVNEVKLELVDSIDKEGYYDLAFHVDVEDDNSGIYYIQISGRLLEIPYFPEFFDVEYHTEDRYPNAKVDTYLYNRMQIESTRVDERLELIRNMDEIDRIMIVVSDKEGNVTTLLQTLEETFAF